MGACMCGREIVTRCPRCPSLTHRHCERSEAIQSSFAPTLDCFVATLLAMTTRMLF